MQAVASLELWFSIRRPQCRFLPFRPWSCASCHLQTSFTLRNARSSRLSISPQYLKGNPKTIQYRHSCRSHHYHCTGVLDGYHTSKKIPNRVKNYWGRQERCSKGLENRPSLCASPVKRIYSVSAPSPKRKTIHPPSNHADRAKRTATPPLQRTCSWQCKLSAH